MREPSFRLRVRWPDGHVSTIFMHDDLFRVRAEWLVRHGLHDHEGWIESEGQLVERM